MREREREREQPARKGRVESREGRTEKGVSVRQKRAFHMLVVLPGQTETELGNVSAKGFAWRGGVSFRRERRVPFSQDYDAPQNDKVASYSSIVNVGSVACNRLALRLNLGSSLLASKHSVQSKRPSTFKYKFDVHLRFISSTN